MDHIYKEMQERVGQITPDTREITIPVRLFIALYEVVTDMSQIEQITRGYRNGGRE